jgi:hypothetical protein
MFNFVKFTACTGILPRNMKKHRISIPGLKRLFRVQTVSKPNFLAPRKVGVMNMFKNNTSSLCFACTYLPGA